jgi:hypothetical protein
MFSHLATSLFAHAAQLFARCITHAFEAAGECRQIAGRKDPAGLAVAHKVFGAADLRTHHRQATGHAFEQRVRQAFLHRREDAEIGDRHVALHLFAGACKHHLLRDAELLRQRFEPFAQLAAAHQQQRGVTVLGKGAGPALQHQLDTLLRIEAAHVDAHQPRIAHEIVAQAAVAFDAVEAAGIHCIGDEMHFVGVESAVHQHPADAGAGGLVGIGQHQQAPAHTHACRRIGIEDAAGHFGETGELDDHRLVQQPAHQAADGRHVAGDVGVDGIVVVAFAPQGPRQLGQHAGRADHRQARIGQAPHGNPVHLVGR